MNIKVNELKQAAKIASDYAEVNLSIEGTGKNKAIYITRGDGVKTSVGIGGDSEYIYAQLIAIIQINEYQAMRRNGMY